MPTWRFVTVDVFTDHRFGGNPLAVFPDATGLSPETMQSLAREFNLSETTFVLPPDDPAHTARVRIFNTSHEMPFAGHPNVGTGYLLAQEGRDRSGVLLFEEQAGLVEIVIERNAGGAVAGATITAPRGLSIETELAAGTIAACTGLGRTDLVWSAHPPLLASTGNPFVFVQVEPDALSRALPDKAAFRRAVSEIPALGGRLGIYLYAIEQDHVRAQHLRARMFSPLDGTWEDPATGSAATTLAALLLSLTHDESIACAIHQGSEMGRPSLLHATARRTETGIRAHVGGRCVPVLRGQVTL